MKEKKSMNNALFAVIIGMILFSMLVIEVEAEQGEITVPPEGTFEYPVNLEKGDIVWYNIALTASEGDISGLVEWWFEDNSGYKGALSEHYGLSSESRGNESGWLKAPSSGIFKFVFKNHDSTNSLTVSYDISVEKNDTPNDTKPLSEILIDYWWIFVILVIIVVIVVLLLIFRKKKKSETTLQTEMLESPVSQSVGEKHEDK